jgi:predicted nucleotidyltransferase
MKMSDFITDNVSTAFLTGSRAFNCHNKKSDVDIAVWIGQLAAVQSVLKTNGYVFEKKSEYNNGEEYIKGVETINIIPLHHVEAIAWLIATIEIKRISDIVTIQNREKRHIVFELHKTTAKFSLGLTELKEGLKLISKLKEMLK